MSLPGFWDDPEKARQVSRDRTVLAAQGDQVRSLDNEVEEIEILLEMTLEEDDEETEEEALARTKALDDSLNRFEIERMLAGPHDLNSAIMDINAGAGGTEAQDWAEMLLRMYMHWADNMGYQTKVMDSLDGDEAGIKSASLTITGPYAFGQLRSEVGIHRLVRISPFDASGRRHTSFASVFVTPELEDDIVIEINEKDLRIDTYRASGAGGQHVNKTSSAIRITHLPTNIVVQCQDEKSQHRNRDRAMKVLKAKLYAREEEKKAEEMAKTHQDMKEIGWGSQIRSYVLHPYRMIKDHRTSVDTGNVDNVLNGDLEIFIRAYLLKGAGLDTGAKESKGKEK